MKLNLLTLILLLLATLSSQGQVIIYDANFSVAGQGYSHTTSSPPPTGPSSVNGGSDTGLVDGQWTVGYTATPLTDGSANTLITAGGNLVSDDLGGAAFFRSETIAISGYTSVSITLQATTQGTDVFNNASEFFRWYYQIDGGALVQGTNFTADGSLNQNFTNIDVTGASTLVVGFNFNVDGGGDGFIVSNVEVSAIPVPEPTAALAMAMAGLAVFGYRRQRRK
jgi:hypothetical protein